MLGDGRGYLATISFELVNNATTRQWALQTCYDNGDVDLQTYEGLYCVSCKLISVKVISITGCPIHGRPVEHVTEENYFFKYKPL